MSGLSMSWSYDVGSIAFGATIGCDVIVCAMVSDSALMGSDGVLTGVRGLDGVLHCASDGLRTTPCHAETRKRLRGFLMMFWWKLGGKFDDLIKP